MYTVDNVISSRNARKLLRHVGRSRREMGSVNRALLLLLGVAAWAGVALTAVLITFNIGDKNQVLMFLPILAVVIVAWAIGEVVTDVVFNRDHGES